MEIVIFCTLPDHEGRFNLHVEPSYTIQRVVKLFCAENEIKYKSNYVLKNRSQETFNKKRQLSSFAIQEGEEFYLCIQDDGQWGCGCNQWWVLVFVCLVIGCVGITAVSVLLSQNYDPVYSYGIGIDAGSSHTKLYIYRWLTGKSNGTGIVEEVFVCPSSSEDPMPPLSAFTGNASEAGNQCIKPCLDRAQSFVPQRERSSTPVMLGATAGMRLLRLSDNASSEAIMSSVRATIASYPFRFDHPDQQAQIIEGSEEGAFAWVTANYLSGTFGFSPMSSMSRFWSTTSMTSTTSLQPTIGALDLGGASTQITFQPQNPSAIAPGYNTTVVLYGTNYEIYTYSYLCYGLNEANRRHLAELIKSEAVENQTYDDPCRPKNFSFVMSSAEIFQVPCTLSSEDPRPENKTFTFIGQSDTRKCQELTAKLFNKSAPCVSPPCSFNGVHQPPLHDNFLGFSGFFYTMRSLNLTQNSNFTLSEFELARDSYCNKSYSEMLKMRQTPYTMSNCFYSHFIYHLLVSGYGFNDSNWNTIQFTNKVNNVELGWILGMMINVTNIIPTLSRVEMITIPVFIILVVLFVMFLLLAFAFRFHASRRTHQQYQSLSSTAENV